MEAWHLQRRLFDARAAASLRGDALDACPEDVLLTLEHPPVYTLGRAGTQANLKFTPEEAKAAGIELHRVERGGQVTYHGPGQLVVYPVLTLARHRKDLHWFVESVEEVVIRTLARAGFAAARRPGFPGVWVGEAKLAQVGIAVSRWVSTHGFAVNVHPDMRHFERIMPCGIEDRPVCSLRQLEDARDPAGQRPRLTVPAVRAMALEAFGEVFECDIVQGSVADLGSATDNLASLSRTTELDHRDAAFHRSEGT